jgi:aminoglycoside phosphotransferase (APT) family kinase protein
MAVTDVGRIARDTGAEAVVEWVERHLGGTVTRLERLPRWRTGWHIDLEQEGGTLQLYARGERGPDFPSPFPLEHEQAVHDLFEANGVPVPHVYGLVEAGPVRTLIMDRVPGQQGLALAANDEERRSLLSTCIAYMVRVHEIDMGQVAGRGFHVPAEAPDIAMSEVFRNVEGAYLSRAHRDPLIEFLRMWLRRNLPPRRTRPAFVTWDSAQFLHDRGQLTALIDFELAHVGDPYMDLAALRTRDSMEPLGDLGLAFDTFAELTGEPVDFDALRYYEISQLTVTLMLQYPVITEPDPDSDYVTHLIWYVDSGRYALDILAERLGAELEHLDWPVPRRSPHGAAYRHLVGSLRAAARREPVWDLVRYGIAVDDREGQPAPTGTTGDLFAGWRSRCNYRLARHLGRVDEIGIEVENREVDDAARLLGGRPSDTADADAGLVSFVHDAGPEADAELLHLFARRMQRRHMLLGPPDSLIVRHPRLQPLPDGSGPDAT